MTTTMQQLWVQAIDSTREATTWTEIVPVKVTPTRVTFEEHGIRTTIRRDYLESQGFYHLTRLGMEVFTDKGRKKWEATRADAIRRQAEELRAADDRMAAAEFERRCAQAKQARGALYVVSRREQH